MLYASMQMKLPTATRACVICGNAYRPKGLVNIRGHQVCCHRPKCKLKRKTQLQKERRAEANNTLFPELFKPQARKKRSAAIVI